MSDSEKITVKGVKIIIGEDAQSLDFALTEEPVIISVEMSDGSKVRILNDIRVTKSDGGTMNMRFGYWTITGELGAGMTVDDGKRSVTMHGAKGVSIGDHNISANYFA
jgi:hypothetical protein